MYSDVASWPQGAVTFETRPICSGLWAGTRGGAVTGVVSVLGVADAVGKERGSKDRWIEEEGKILRIIGLRMLFFLSFYEGSQVSCFLFIAPAFLFNLKIDFP